VAIVAAPIFDGDRWRLGDCRSGNERVLDFFLVLTDAERGKCCTYLSIRHRVYLSLDDNSSDQ
jgi:hypothetical protein